MNFSCVFTNLTLRPRCQSPAPTPGTGPAGMSFSCSSMSPSLNVRSRSGRRCARVALRLLTSSETASARRVRAREQGERRGSAGRLSGVGWVRSMARVLIEGEAADAGGVHLRGDHPAALKAWAGPADHPEFRCEKPQLCPPPLRRCALGHCFLATAASTSPSSTSSTRRPSGSPRSAPCSTSSLVTGLMPRTLATSPQSGGQRLSPWTSSAAGFPARMSPPSGRWRAWCPARDRVSGRSWPKRLSSSAPSS